MSASAAPANSSATTTFVVGTGSQPDCLPARHHHHLQRHQPLHPLAEGGGPGAAFNGGTTWAHYELRYAGAPGAPTPVTASAGSTTATVNWAAPTNTGNAPLFDYQVTLTPTVGAPVTQTVLAGTTTANFTGLTNFTDYTPSVIARNTAVDGTTHFPGAPATGPVVTPAPPGPTALSGSPGNTQVDLSWVAPVGPVVDEYQIEMTPTSPAGAPTTINTGSTATSRTVTRPDQRHRLQLPGARPATAPASGATPTPCR